MFVVGNQGNMRVWRSGDQFKRWKETDRVLS